MQLYELIKKLDENGIKNPVNRKNLILGAASFSLTALLGLLRQKGVLDEHDVQWLNENFNKFVEDSIQGLLREYQDARKKMIEKFSPLGVSDDEIDKLFKEKL